MKTKTKFLKWCNVLSDNGKFNLVLNPYSANPMSMNVCIMEVKQDTILGDKILEEMGFSDT